MATITTESVKRVIDVLQAATLELLKEGNGSGVIVHLMITNVLAMMVAEAEKENEEDARRAWQ